MSETAGTTRRRSSVKGDEETTSGESEGKIVSDYDEALEAGYIGGPIDETDDTVAGVAARESSG